MNASLIDSGIAPGEDREQGAIEDDNDIFV